LKKYDIAVIPLFALKELLFHKFVDERAIAKYEIISKVKQFNTHAV